MKKNKFSALLISVLMVITMLSLASATAFARMLEPTISILTASTTSITLDDDEMRPGEAVIYAEEYIEAEDFDVLVYAKNGTEYSCVSYEFDRWDVDNSGFSATFEELKSSGDRIYIFGSISEDSETKIAQITALTTAMKFSDSSMEESEAKTIVENELTNPVEQTIVLYADDGECYYGIVYEAAGLSYEWNRIYITDYTVEGIKTILPYYPAVYIIGTVTNGLNVTVDANITNGTVTADKATAEKGETVTLTVTPASGYELDTLTVTKTGDTSTTVTVTDNKFTMPEYNVTVTASFKAAHVHNRKYTAEGTKIVVTCQAENCPCQSQSIELNGYSITYDTYSHEAVCIAVLEDEDINYTIEYTDSEGRKVSGAPIDAGNYTASITIEDAGVSVACVISPKLLNVEGSTVSSKTYDGTTSATVTPGVLNGVITGTSVSIDTATGTFDNADVGTSKTVSVSYTLKGDDAENYTIENETLSGEITAAAPTVSELEKTYAECKKITLAVPEIKGVDGEALEGVTVEYAINTENTAPETGWQTSTEFTKLKANTTYYFFVKVTVNDNTNYSDYISEGVAIATNAHEMTKYGYVASTCTVQGHNTYYKCNVCKNVYVDKEGTHVTTAKAQARKLTKHKLTYFGGYAPTCTRAGRIAYYQCSVCKKVFKDEAATKEITLAEVKLSAKTHSLVKVAYKKATCTETGNYTYYKCTTCGKCYIYSDGTKLTSEKDQTIKLKAHKLSLVAEKEATATENGNTAYYKCSGCTKIFLDENGTNETTYEAVTVSYAED